MENKNYFETFSKTSKKVKYDNHNVASNVPDIFHTTKSYQIFHRDDIPNNTKGYDKFYCVFCHKELIIAKTTHVPPYFKHKDGPCEILSKIFDLNTQQELTGHGISKENIVKGYELDIYLYEKIISIIESNNEILLPGSSTLIGNENLWRSGRFPYIKYEKIDLEDELFPLIVLTNKDGQQIGLLIKNSYIDANTRFETIKKKNISTIEINIIQLRKQLLRFFNDSAISIDNISEKLRKSIEMTLTQILMDDINNKRWIYDKKLYEFSILQKKEFIARKLFVDDISNKTDFWKGVLNRTNLGSDYIYIIPYDKTHFLYEKWEKIELRPFLYRLIQSNKYQICTKTNLYGEEFNNDFDTTDSYNIENIKQKILMRFFEDSILNTFCFNVPTIQEFDNIYNKIDKKYLYTFYTLYVRKKAFSFKMTRVCDKDQVFKEMKNLVTFMNNVLNENDKALEKYHIQNKSILYFSLTSFLDLYMESIKFRNDTFNKKQMQLIYKTLFSNQVDYILKLCEIDKYEKYRYDLLQILPREILLLEPAKSALRIYLRKEVSDNQIKNSHAKRFIEYYYDKPFVDTIEQLSQDIGLKIIDNSLSYGNDMINKLNSKNKQKKQTYKQKNNSIYYINNKYRRQD